MSFNARWFAAISLMAMALLAPSNSVCQSAVNKRGDAETARLLREGRADDALARVEGLLSNSPGNLVNLGFKVRALLDLHRDEEAYAAVIGPATLHPEWPVLRAMAGESALALGRPDEAVRLWSPLYKRRDLAWASDAYLRSIRALMASGQEKRAAELLAEAFAEIPDLSTDFLWQKLQLTRSGPKGVLLADAIAKADPTAAEDLAPLRAEFAAVGDGELFDESPSPGGASACRFERVERPWNWNPAAKGRVMQFRGSQAYPARLLPATLGGVKGYRMVFDSGSPMVIISRRVARDLDLKPIGTVSCTGVFGGGRRWSPIVLLPSVGLCGMQVENVPAAILDGIEDRANRVDGILPLGLFKRHGVLYDPGAGRLELLPAGTPAADVLGQNSSVVPSLWFNGKPYVRVGVNGHEARFFLLDTGSAMTVLDRGCAEELNIRSYSATEAAVVEGLLGQITVRKIDGLELAFGSLLVRAQGCPVLDLTARDRVASVGLLGRDVLDGLQVYFDYSSGTVAVKPDRN